MGFNQLAEAWKNHQEFQRHRSRFSRRMEFLFVTMIVVGVGWMVTGAIIEARRSGHIRGKLIPVDPPLEKNRVHASSGVSIVLPKNWEVRDTAGSQLLWITPKSGIRRVGAWIEVETGEKTKPPNAVVCRPVQFRGAPAVESMSVVRLGTFDDPTTSEYRLYFQLKDQWYTIVYFIAERRTELPKMVRSYLETVRFPGEQLPIVPKGPEEERGKSEVVK